MVDIVYALGNGSVWNDNEIRYSLRSVEKHLRGYRNVYIVGKLPLFLKNIFHIPYDDIYRCKETNIYYKILRACQEQNISDDFLFFNDDHFLNNHFDAQTFPSFHKGDLINLINRLPEYNLYRRSLIMTAKTLKSLNLSTINFDTHTPLLYNKSNFLEIMPKYDWSNRFGFTVKSMYANSLKLQGTAEPDYKLNYPSTKQQIYNFISPSKIWSIGNKAINDELNQVLQELFITPSKWEF